MGKTPGTPNGGPKRMQEPPRRWFRFSLRTMFVVVTVLAVWLGGELAHIRERKATVAKINQKNGSFVFPTSQYKPPDLPRKWPLGREPRIPFWRSWLGDEPVAIVVYDGNDLDRGRLKALFPEASEIMLTADIENANQQH